MGVDEITPGNIIETSLTLSPDKSISLYINNVLITKTTITTLYNTIDTISIGGTNAHIYQLIWKLIGFSKVYDINVNNIKVINVLQDNIVNNQVLYTDTNKTDYIETNNILEFTNSIELKKCTHNIYYYDHVLSSNNS